MTYDLTCIPEFARPWAQRCLASVADVSEEDMRNVGDWLAALAIERPYIVENPGRLVRMTWAQAMTAQRKWHDAIAAKTDRLIAEKKGFGGAPNDIEPFLALENGFLWVRITSPKGLDYEGNAMGHCVGGGNYDEDCNILSLRDADNLPQCTVEWDEQGGIVQQVQGRANGQVVERYHPMVRALVDHLQPNVVHDAGKFGHVFVRLNGQPARLISWRDLKDGDVVDGILSLYGCTAVSHLPNGLVVGGGLNLHGCTSLRNLPKGLVVCGALNLDGCTALTHLTDVFVARGSINLHNCISLTHLSDKLTVHGHMNLSGCTSLTHLPDGLVMKGSLNLRGCTSLTHLPDDLAVVGGDLVLLGCSALTHLPGNILCTASIFLPDGTRHSSVADARAWFAERFPDVRSPETELATAARP